MGSRAGKQAFLWILTGLLAEAVAGCAAQHKTAAPPSGPPVQLLQASRQQLVTSYNEQANSIHSVNASVSMKLTAGTAYAGVIKSYHEISGFILAQKPADIRVIGQAPIVGTTIFDMVSDGTMFHMYIPSKSTFLEGPANLQKESAKPIENLRPQHLLQAIFWNPIPAGSPVLFEAGDATESRYYTLTIATPGPGAETSAAAGGNQELSWQIDRKIWFDRANLSVARLQIYDSSGNVTSDIRYAGWRAFGNVRFPEDVVIMRPADDYELEIHVKKLTPNEAIPAARFELKQPAGTRLVRVGEGTQEPKP